MSRTQQSTVVTLTPAGRVLEALLRLPLGFDPNECYPAIIYTLAPAHAAEPSQRKRYDELLGNAAFVSLTLKYPECHASDDCQETHQQDIRSARDHLRGYPFIDSQRIGVLGLAPVATWRAAHHPGECRDEGIFRAVADPFGDPGD
ncbi:hypothetical protein PspTeo4_16184 [Pseudomonas sp. Teo4]|nr:hypothetical protein [Pseudomonas sp. Teo4]